MSLFKNVKRLLQHMLCRHDLAWVGSVVSANGVSALWVCTKCGEISGDVAAPLGAVSARYVDHLTSAAVGNLSRGVPN